MKLKSLIQLSLLVTWLMVNTSCSGPKTASSTLTGGASTAKASMIDDARKRQAEEKLIEAKKMEILGDEQAALNLYRECIRIDP
ncbi:MAG TPA: hypothetical protein PLD84_07030, partial [Chitinophagales bacterium]|nr:hypothetical protein [Chitinophagales bacterium]